MSELERKEEQKEPYALLWVDLETSGLEPTEGIILEAAWWATEFRYPWRPLPHRYAKIRTSELESFVLSVDDYESWNPFDLDPVVFDMHSRSGLLSEVKRSKHNTASLAAKLSLTVSTWPPLSRAAGDLVLLAGSSVAFDQRWLRAKMSTHALHDNLSHRVFDVSNLMNMCRALGMPYPKAEPSVHRAKEDLLRSIDLARICVGWLEANGFKLPFVTEGEVVQYGLPEEAPYGL